jgi:hypothetical protein
MKEYTKYLDDACQYLDNYEIPNTTIQMRALPTQLQSINVALLMAICDLIKVMQDKK